MPDPGPVSLTVLAELVPDGASLALPADYGGVAMAATFALIRRRARRLRLFGAPTSGLQTDLLIGAGAVDTLETAGMALGEWGVGPRFRDALRRDGLVIRDSTCPAQHAALQAGEKGIPFLPLRGILGTDLLTSRPDWPVIQNPLAKDADPIVLIPAFRPDIALFHAALADSAGNVWIGVRRELVTLAHAAHRTLVTVEALYPGDLLDDPLMAPGTLPHLYVDHVTVAPGGSWPLAFGDQHPACDEALSRYAEAAKTDDGFTAILAEWLR